MKFRLKAFALLALTVALFASSLYLDSRFSPRRAQTVPAPAPAAPGQNPAGDIFDYLERHPDATRPRVVPARDPDWIHI